MKRDNFTGPSPCLKCTPIGGLPKPEQVFNLYWSEETLDQIVLETNRYARSPLPHKPNEEQCTKGGKRVIAKKTYPILHHIFHADQFFGNNFCVLAPNDSRFIE